MTFWGDDLKCLISICFQKHTNNKLITTVIEFGGDGKLAVAMDLEV